MAVGVAGLYFAGKRKSWGWLIGVGVQPLWIIYAVATRQWGFVVSAVLYGAAHLTNYIRWKKEATAHDRHGDQMP